jgi:hypothetical protein
MTAKLGLLALTASALLVACSGEKLTPALEEPIRVTGAQFRKGLLPGSPPPTDPEAEAPSPKVTSISLAGLLVTPGYSGKRISGRASTDSVAVGLRLDDLGSGYWVIPVGAPDPTAHGEYSWSARLDFSREVPGGEHELFMVGIDQEGRAGAQFSSRLCFTSAIGDGSVCDPRQAPPAAVVSLAWDVGADLDLRVVTPAGKVVDAKHPSTALLADAGAAVDSTAPGTGVLDRDSVRGCIVDGVERENLIFASEPPAGSYSLYANSHEACGLPSVRFTMTVHRAVAGEDGGAPALTETFRRSGTLLASDANGGAELGMFVGTLEVN